MNVLRHAEDGTHDRNGSFGKVKKFRRFIRGPRDGAIRAGARCAAGRVYSAGAGLGGLLKPSGRTGKGVPIAGCETTPRRGHETRRTELPSIKHTASYSEDMSRIYSYNFCATEASRTGNLKVGTYIAQDQVGITYSHLIVAFDSNSDHALDSDAGPNADLKPSLDIVASDDSAFSRRIYLFSTISLFFKLCIRTTSRKRGRGVLIMIDIRENDFQKNTSRESNVRQWCGSTASVGVTETPEKNHVARRQ
ncbi:hypothetical protein EVAR_52722_1 [Eumeta japonica]|uniref:Uncharacterized protein n=1 Tax=Eumeta variegata TaxID=151549 RepID=A0A4C1ZCM4_EUMVA|nr:hypothetical protein EVAR_52722_1 [Eumeta japonica]